MFVFLPLGCLFLMGVFLDSHLTESKQERRTLSEWPANFWVDLKGVESYLSDHIKGREKMLDFYFQSGLALNLGNNTTIIGKEGWLFRNSFGNKENIHNLKSYQNKVDFSQEEFEAILKNISAIQTWCDEHNIKLYVMFPPDKHRVYARYMPSYIFRHNRKSLAKRVSEILPKNVRFIPLEDRLTQLSYTAPEPVYYKQESHWSEYGAYQSYLLLMDEVRKDFKDVLIAEPSDFSVTKTNRIWTPYFWDGLMMDGNLWISGLKGYEDKIYTRYEIAKNSEIKIERNKSWRTSVNPNKKYNAYLIGDSYATYSFYFFAAGFKNVIFYRFNENGEEWGIRWSERRKEMLENKTDILVLSVSDLKLRDLFEAF
ncbi:MAG: hypothetical protein IKY98_01655 [Alphaproteobacteria bacterium]|nr:hypothetical protein [Alphaproteobacteria bacterium]